MLTSDPIQCECNYRNTYNSMLQPSGEASKRQQQVPSSSQGGRSARHGSVSSSSGNSGDDGDGVDNWRRRPNRRGTPNNKPLASRHRFPTEDEDDERTDSAEEDCDEESTKTSKKAAHLLLQDNDSALFPAQPPFTSLETGGQQAPFQDHPILKPLSPTAMAVGYGAELQPMDQGAPDSPLVLSDGGPPSSSSDIAITQVGTAGQARGASRWGDLEMELAVLLSPSW